VLSRELKTPNMKNQLVMKCYTGPWNGGWWWAVVKMVMNLLFP
jgi:hypothetical protein